MALRSSNSTLYDEIEVIVIAKGFHRMRFLTPEDRRRFRENFKYRASKQGMRLRGCGVFLEVLRSVNHAEG